MDIKDRVDKALESIDNVILSAYSARWPLEEVFILADMNKVSEVIYSGPATIVKFEDGRKTITKCQPYDSYDREKGILFALVKAAYPDWHEIMSKWCWNDKQ